MRCFQLDFFYIYRSSKTLNFQKTNEFKQFIRQCFGLHLSQVNTIYKYVQLNKIAKKCKNQARTVPIRKNKVLKIYTTNKLD